MFNDFCTWTQLIMSKYLSELLPNLIFFCVAHTLTDFVFNRIFCTVELTDATTKAAHEFRYLLATKKEQDDQENEHKLSSSQVTEK